jgi:hypothetical protein
MPAREDAPYLEYCKIDVVERKLRTVTISAWIHVEKTRCRAIAHPRQAVAVAAKSLVVLHGPQLIPAHLLAHPTPALTSRARSGRHHP